MNILIIGGGGREHTIAWKLAQSPNCGKLFVAPGNAGTHEIGTNLAIGINDFADIKKAVLSNDIQMVIVGPEDPLVNGIHNFFLKDKQLNEVIVVGPQKDAATLEGSKEFAKEFMKAHNIPTAQYDSFTAETVEEGCQFLDTMNPPYVLKADGLAAGKGVLILQDLVEAKDELRQMLVGQKFGAASQKVVIEEFLDGIELSCFVLTDGKNYLTLPMAKDYKRIGEGDTGLNTGGMGAISPVPFASDAFMKKIEERVIKPTMVGFQKSNLPFQGFVFIGLIKVGDDPFVIEYNVRMGDPETEVVFPRVQNDWVDLFKAVGTQSLDQHQLKIDPRTAATIMAVSGGYPEAYEKGKTITGIESVVNSEVFHAGTQVDKDLVKTSGGRVLAVTSFGKDHKEALSKSYEALKKIDFKGMYYRKDLGFDL
ncbi:MAG: phosphoribosylamine--glycine ligase [Flavobacteriaceae bacterium]|jgi:phosphoribosylamine---glycine ligase|nr:phosphoribosylamine--glycine ligase [Flavobacteriaceae bacterium]MDO7581556.1 phosphoribosylamine--glycine ligase [Flavobacteriaceae bacterium]MDO7590982.1 phosphoribosylamine--glycine ligase [Flavobacteriaceae bacterium]MDO7599077.1 phosphoribosylamine--glycine ligase [Flavobacteriaceae bacterium]MDO7604035.1 phosphoribosylamine--glycine ligase [Flavobacteriaceae bacterium]